MASGLQSDGKGEPPFTLRIFLPLLLLQPISNSISEEGCTAGLVLLREPSCAKPSQAKPSQAKPSMQRSLEGTPPKQPPDTPCRRRYISLTDPALPTPPPPLPPSPPPPQGLDALEKYPGGGPAERVVNVLFGSVPPSAVGMARTVPLPSVPPRVMAAAAAATAGSLNDSQREAVAFALATDDVALIHGPPGRWVRFSERFLLLLVPPYHRVLTFIAVCMCIPLFFYLLCWCCCCSCWYWSLLALLLLLLLLLPLLRLHQQLHCARPIVLGLCV